MQQAETTIKYWIGQNDEYPMHYRENGAWQGTWMKFIEAFTDETGMTAELVTEKDGLKISTSEALDMLEQGELDMVLGMPAEMSGFAASECIYGNELTGYILKDSPQAGPSDFENCYWAIDSAFKDMLAGTPFEGHTVDFEDRAQLYEALNRGDVYGVLDTRGGLDFEALVGHDFAYRQCVAVNLPYTECAYVRMGEEQLLEAVNAACRQTAAETDTQYSRNYANLLADSYTAASGFRTATYALGAASVVLAAGCAVLFSKLKSHRKLEEAKLRTVLAGDESKELLELDLHTGKLRSYNDFAVFGDRGRTIPNPVKLSELSELLGYDFVSHYSNVSTHISRKYEGRLIIHIGGEKLYIAEEGTRSGHTLMLTLTRM